MTTPCPASKPDLRCAPGSARGLVAALVLVLAGCGSQPVPPDWQTNAKSAIEEAMQAHLRGDTRLETLAYQRARAEVARTGRPDLAARVELMRCAAHVAGLAFEPCAGFEKLRIDAAPAEAAYAAYLEARPLPREQVERLPASHQAPAAALAGGVFTAPQLQAIEDPLSRLIALAVLFRAGKADPAMIALGADTASAQGWRRPLLAWLEVQALHADKAGDAGEAQRLRRRIELVTRAR